eukprot:2441588-Pyramimonas_sp.AAC.2
MTDVVPSPTSSSCVRLSSIIACFRVGFGGRGSEKGQHTVCRTRAYAFQSHTTVRYYTRDHGKTPRC